MTACRSFWQAREGHLGLRACQVHRLIAFSRECVRGSGRGDIDGKETCELADHVMGQRHIDHGLSNPSFSASSVGLVHELRNRWPGPVDAQADALFLTLQRYRKRPGLRAIVSAEGRLRWERLGFDRQNNRFAYVEVGDLRGIVFQS